MGAIQRLAVINNATFAIYMNYVFGNTAENIHKDLRRKAAIFNR